jgi:hypothetical protein
MEINPETNLSFKGKRIGGFMYIHKSGQKLIASNYAEAIKKSLPLLRDFSTWNVIKLNIKNPKKLSFLEYESFEHAEFPSLFRSCQVDLNLKKTTVRQHSNINPPVLHRKELLMHPNHPEREKFKNLTDQLENMGAFKDIVKLGTKLRWQAELARLEITVHNHLATRTSN